MKSNYHSFWTPLHHASAQGNRKIVELLLNHYDIYPDLKDKYVIFDNS